MKDLVPPCGAQGCLCSDSQLTGHWPLPGGQVDLAAPRKHRGHELGLPAHPTLGNRRGAGGRRVRAEPWSEPHFRALATDMGWVSSGTLRAHHNSSEEEGKVSSFSYSKKGVKGFQRTH